MNKNKFDVLVYIERYQTEKLSQRAIATELGISVGTVNKVISELVSDNYLVQDEDTTYKVTDEAYAYLEPHKVKRAIFLAAGFGSRLVPVTYNTPKPLIRVNGVRMIDTLLDAVLDAGIEDITIVRGYLKEQFDTLLPKYPMLKFIDNDDYNIANNISSAILIKDQLENSVVLESDLYLSNKNVIRKYEQHTNYKVVKMDRTDDWCFDTQGTLVTNVNIGGVNTHQMYGISYWSKEDGLKMSKHIEEAYEMPGGKELFWDEVPLKVFKKDYNINIHEIKVEDIVEIDSYAELCEVDSIYKENMIINK